MDTYFVFKNGKLITILQTTADTLKTALESDYIVRNPQDAEKQIAEWKRTRWSGK